MKLVRVFFGEVDFLVYVFCRVKGFRGWEVAFEILEFYGGVWGEKVEL